MKLLIIVSRVILLSLVEIVISAEVVDHGWLHQDLSGPALGLQCVEHTATAVWHDALPVIHLLLL